MIRVDFTHSGDKAKESLARQYGVSGVPTIIFLKPGGEERADLRVNDILEPDQFLARMDELKNWESSSSGKWTAIHSDLGEGLFPRVLESPIMSATALDLAPGSS